MGQAGRFLLLITESCALSLHPQCRDENKRLLPESQTTVTCQVDPLSLPEPDRGAPASNPEAFHPLPLSRWEQKEPRTHTDPSSTSPRPVTKGCFQLPGPQKALAWGRACTQPWAALPPLSTHASSKHDSAVLLPGWGASRLSIPRPGHTPSLCSPDQDAREPARSGPSLPPASAGLRYQLCFISGRARWQRGVAAAAAEPTQVP